jgi:SAM-dependent methyltransferase
LSIEGNKKTIYIRGKYMAYKDLIRENSDSLAKERGKWIDRNSYFYEDDYNYMKFLISKGARVLELGCGTGCLLDKLAPSYGVGVDLSGAMVEVAANLYPNLKFIQGDAEDPQLISSLNGPFDYIVLSDILGYIEDIEVLFDMLHVLCDTDTRIVIAYHSWRWEPVLKLGEKLKLKMPSVEMNWLSTDDTINFLNLSDFELVKRDWRQLIPRSMFGIGSIVNNFIGPLPVIRRLALRNYVVARPIRNIKTKNLSTTVLIPCRNEKGNVEYACRYCRTCNTSRS